MPKSWTSAASDWLPVETKPRSCCAGENLPVEGGPAQTTDSVCGMSVDPSKTPWRHEGGGVTHFFFSAHCRDAFVAKSHPERGSQPAPVTPAAQGYTCPMHPEVRHEGPGSRPKCGMALEPVHPAPTTARTQWICPMHPQIVRDGPRPLVDSQQYSALVTVVILTTLATPPLLRWPLSKSALDPRGVAAPNAPASPGTR